MRISGAEADDNGSEQGGKPTLSLDAIAVIGRGVRPALARTVAAVIAEPWGSASTSQTSRPDLARR